MGDKSNIHPGDATTAFPFACQGPTTAPEVYYGLTPRQYAAIELRVTDSGLRWLDAMIEKSRRMDYAGQAMQSLIASPSLAGFDYDGDPAYSSRLKFNVEKLAKSAHQIADAMLNHHSPPPAEQADAMVDNIAAYRKSNP